MITEIELAFAALRKKWPGEEYSFDLVFGSDGKVEVMVFKSLTEDTVDGVEHVIADSLDQALRKVLR